MNDFSTSASGLLRRATALHERGELHEAIAILREAYAAIASDSRNHTVTTFLRLPAYLQEAGQREEAWDALFEFLKNGYPTQPATPELVAMDRSAIYRALQLFLEREGHFLPAVLYGVLALYYWASGLRSQKRFAEFAALISAATAPSSRGAVRSSSVFTTGTSAGMRSSRLAFRRSLPSSSLSRRGEAKAANSANLFWARRPDAQ